MENEVTNVGFTVDAGLIQRLGYELVGRAETAVSELIKNSYDADATVVVNPEKPDVPLNKNDAFQKVQKRHVQEKR